MKVSVVIPSYNQGRFLEATLESVLGQEGESEVLVQDGGSTDGSVSILERYADRIDYVSRPDGGQSDAINQGLQRAGGDILAYLNSDDLYWPNALRHVVQYFEAHPDCLALYGDAWHLHEDGSIMAPYPTEPWSYPRLLEVCYLCQPAVFWRREVIERFGLFDPTLLYALDYDYWLRAGHEIAFHHLAGVTLAGSRLHPETKTLSRRIEAHHEMLEVIMRHLAEPPYLWLKKCALVTVECALSENEPEMANDRMRQALWVQAVMEIADQHRIPLSLAFLRELEMSIPAV
ncbi:MAG: glycosyltransferase family 2 protein [Chthoniobacterales bacterium]